MDNNLNRSVWFDIPVGDMASAQRFYGKLFDWVFIPLPSFSSVDYVMIESRGKLIGGLRRADGLPSKGKAPVLYFTVHRLKTAVEQALSLGSKKVGGEVRLGSNRGFYQLIADLDENVIGLWALV